MTARQRCADLFPWVVYALACALFGAGAVLAVAGGPVLKARCEARIGPAPQVPALPLKRLGRPHG